MCGRFSLTHALKELADLFDLANLEDFPPRYNIAPTQPIVVIRVGPDNRREAILIRWGLIPHWVKDPNEFSLLIQARAETVIEKASFKSAIRHRRVLIPASGFYEWHRPDNKKLPKQAYWIRPIHGRTIAFAGLMETWMGKDGTEIDTGCVLTTQSNDKIGNIHHRMPVVIEPNDFDRWLDCKNHEPRDIADIMIAAPDEYFEAIAVSDRVNKVANTGPEIQTPGKAEPMKIPNSKRRSEPDDRQMDLF